MKRVFLFFLGLLISCTPPAPKTKIALREYEKEKAKWHDLILGIWLSDKDSQSLILFKDEKAFDIKFNSHISTESDFSLDYPQVCCTGEVVYIPGNYNPLTLKMRGEYYLIDTITDKKLVIIHNVDNVTLSFTRIKSSDLYHFLQRHDFLVL